MIPVYERNFSLAKLSSFNMAKNLTEYNMKTSHIQSDIISIEQKYTVSNKYDHSFLVIYMYSVRDFF